MGCENHSWVLTHNGDQVCSVEGCGAVMDGESGEILETVDKT